MYYTYDSHNILIEGCWRNNGSSRYGVKIVNNTIINVTGGVSNYGIFIYNSKDSYISDNVVYDVSGYGIEINNANENMVKFNKIYNSSYYGIYLLEGQTITQFTGIFFISITTLGTCITTHFFRHVMMEIIISGTPQRNRELLA